MIETWGNRQCSAATVLRERRRHQWESIGDDCEAINHLGVVGSHRCVHPYQTKMRRREKRIHFLHSHAFQLGTPHDDLILFFLQNLWIGYGTITPTYESRQCWVQSVCQDHGKVIHEESHLVGGAQLKGNNRIRNLLDVNCQKSPVCIIINT